MRRWVAFSGVVSSRPRGFFFGRFKSAGHAQRFLAAYGPIAQHFRPGRQLFSGPKYPQEMQQRFQTWWEITGLAPAA
jgi:putative transposase